ncbi:PREDICTED: fibroblast growth factor-binding protein 3 [Nanorana parkeri]|uniref:fibroblast growth factor-binding protein 3 n=1 Tax=Nanorana parkeri TaxID=125878 RepID=UPI000854838B|nr:PREDICTED: fibroblast growth factor-binding protein 3 [Nanorana parkeri]
MRHSSVISVIFLLHCLATLQSVLGKTNKTASKKAEPPTFERSRQFTNKHKHVCTLEIVGDATVSLSLSCNEPTGSSYNCTYEGEPQRCPLYATKAKQYWKQILGKIKKMENTCEDKTIKSRLCRKSEAVQSQLRKIESDVTAELEKSQIKGKGRVKETSRGLKESPLNPETNENAGAEKKSAAKKKKHDSKSHRNPHPSALPSLPDLTTAREVNDDIIEQNENLADTYCAEKWHSLCSLLVNFWNG